jgi:hypothetical protein
MAAVAEVVGVNAKHEKLDQRATLCLSSREYQLLMDTAARLDMPLSKLLRKAALLTLGVRQPDLK